MNQGAIRILHLRILTCSAFLTLTSCCILADLVSDLTSRSSTAELTMRLKAIVPIDTDYSTIEDGTIQSVNCDGCLRSRGVLDEAEAARLHLDSVETHDQIDDLTTSREKLEQLALKCEEGEVSDVECCGCLQTLSIFLFGKIYSQKKKLG